MMPERLFGGQIRMLMEKVADRGEENANNGSHCCHEQDAPPFC
jgi:hypothetical protein